MLILSKLHNAFEQITTLENIRLAYFDLSLKFDEESQTKRYRGLDGLALYNLDFVSEETFLLIQAEMKVLKEIAPAYLMSIPKKNGKKRKIYVYPVKERIKAEAIYRVLEPFFDKYLSDFLYSYRSSHPSYYAARSAVRRYKRYYGHNHVLVTDIADYADSIDHDLLMVKLSTLGLDGKTLKLLELFIKTKTHEKGNLITRPKGVLTGTPLYAILSNFYMDEFDAWAGKYVAFYRRVGDDMIAMDKDIKKITLVQEKLFETVKALKLDINTNKACCIKDTEPFVFLGYQFKQGRIRFDPSSMSKAKEKWTKEFSHKKGKSMTAKIQYLKSVSRQRVGAPDHEFGRLMEQKILVDDEKHVKHFSDALIGSVSSFFFGYDNPEKRRQTEKVLKKANIRSLFEHYRQIRSRRT